MMAGTVINRADERALRTLLLTAQNLLWDWLSAGLTDATAVAILRVLFADEGTRLSKGPTRLAHVGQRIVEILDRDALMSREIIEAIWHDTDIDAPWLCHTLKSPGRFTFTHGADKDA